MSEIGDHAGGGCAGHKADDNFHRSHQNGADDHIEAIRPDLVDTLLPAGLNSTYKLTDVAYNLHHEKDLEQSETEYHEYGYPVFCFQVFKQQFKHILPPVSSINHSLFLTIPVRIQVP